MRNSTVHQVAETTKGKDFLLISSCFQGSTDFSSIPVIIVRLIVLEKSGRGQVSLHVHVLTDTGKIH